VTLVSVVVPVYQNAGSLRDLAARLQAVAAACTPSEFDFVFVDDGSTDESFAVLRDLAREDPRVRVVKLSRNFGSNAALLAGLVAAKGDAAVVVAADLQDPPELIPKMLALWAEGHRVVLAARRSRDDPFWTRALAATFYALFRRLAIRTMPENGFDFFLVDRRVRDLLVGIQENNAYLMGLVLWLGFAPAVVHYDRVARDRRYGSSAWTFWKKVKHFADSFVAFSYAPVRLASLTGFVVVLIGFAYGALVLYLRLARGFDVGGWASLMLVILLVAGIQILMLGVLGEYLWRNLEETRRRPRFIVETVVDFGGEAPADLLDGELQRRSGRHASSPSGSTS
jgi:glycosyltransferase involved in cell wall biosynthesis